MRTINLGTSTLKVPVVAVGCMRIVDLSAADAERFVASALEMGVNFFDHADIYGRGKSEEVFAQAAHMSSNVREKLIIQSKCGIRFGWYDFSKKHILEAVDGSLKRLRTDYLDVLLLHRPDALAEPDEVAEAFDILESSGKVRHFGVSNHNTAQIRLLQKYVKQPIAVNQLQLSIAHAGLISEGINVNVANESAVNRDGGVLDFCRLNGITVQPWSPFQYGMMEGVFIGSGRYGELNLKLNEAAEAYGASATTIALAWLLRHPAKMQPVVGTMNVQRLKECVHAADITLSREEWYALYRSAGNMVP